MSYISMPGSSYLVAKHPSNYSLGPVKLDQEGGYAEKHVFRRVRTEFTTRGAVANVWV
jgi:hypothetical protein